MSAAGRSWFEDQDELERDYDPVRCDRCHMFTCPDRINLTSEGWLSEGVFRASRAVRWIDEWRGSRELLVAALGKAVA